MTDVIYATIKPSTSNFTIKTFTSNNIVQAKLVVSAASIVVDTDNNGGFQPTQTGITLKNIIASAQQAMRLDLLSDVVPDDANTAAGSTLVYDPEVDKYVVKLLDLDGGLF